MRRYAAVMRRGFRARRRACRAKVVSRRAHGFGLMGAVVGKLVKVKFIACGDVRAVVYYILAARPGFDSGVQFHEAER